MKVYLVSHPLNEANHFEWLCQGVFSSVEAARTACRLENDAIVEFTIDQDVTDIEDFVVVYPLRHPVSDRV